MVVVHIFCYLCDLCRGESIAFELYLIKTISCLLADIIRSIIFCYWNWKHMPCLAVRLLSGLLLSFFAAGHYRNAEGAMAGHILLSSGHLHWACDTRSLTLHALTHIKLIVTCQWWMSPILLLFGPHLPLLLRCTKFGQLILRKIITIVTSYHILRLKMHQFQFWLGLRWLRSLGLLAGFSMGFYFQGMWWDERSWGEGRRRGKGKAERREMGNITLINGMITWQTRFMSFAYIQEEHRLS